MKILALILNLPWSIIGLFLALCSLPHRISLNKVPLSFIIHVRTFWGQTWLPSHKGVRASSIGNVVLLGSNLLPKDLEHELIHVRQYEQRPFVQAFLYVVETLRHGYKNNKYEIEAYEKAGNKYVANDLGLDKVAAIYDNGQAESQQITQDASINTDYKLVQLSANDIRDKYDFCGSCTECSARRYGRCTSKTQKKNGCFDESGASKTGTQEYADFCQKIEEIITYFNEIGGRS